MLHNFGKNSLETVTFTVLSFFSGHALLPPTGIHPFKLLSAFTPLFQPCTSLLSPLSPPSPSPPINNQFTVSTDGVGMFKVSSLLVFYVLYISSTFHPYLRFNIAALESPLSPPPASLFFPLHFHSSFCFHRRRLV